MNGNVKDIHKRKSPRKVLVIQLRRIGDILLTTPVARVLRENFQNAQVDFMVESPGDEVLRNNPYIHDILVYDRARPFHEIKKVYSLRYDWVLDFLNNPRSAQITLFSGAPLRAGFSVRGWKAAYNFSIPHSDKVRYIVDEKLSLLEALNLRISGTYLPEFYLQQKEYDFADKYWNDYKLNNKKIVGISPAHRRATRQWTELGFSEVSRALTLTGYQVIVFWGPGERSLAERIADRGKGILAPEMTLRQMAVLLSKCRFVITNDSGLMHLSVAVGTKTITLYGPTNPVSWNPGGKHQEIRVPGLSCLGCNLNVCPHQHECMEWLSPQQVLSICQRSS